jgi:hypothetical protein
LWHKQAPAIRGVFKHETVTHVLNSLPDTAWRHVHEANFIVHTTGDVTSCDMDSTAATVALKWQWLVAMALVQLCQANGY